MAADPWGLFELVSAVRAFFDAEGVTASVVVGSRERFKQTNTGPGGANRIVFQPWDDSGNGGRMAEASQPGPRYNTNGTAVRSIGNWEQVVTVYVWAVDRAYPNDEEKQLAATQELLVWLMRAVRAHARAAARWGNVGWTIDGTERAFGRELSIGLVYGHPIPDLAQDVVVPTLGPITKTLTTNVEDDG